MKLAVRRYRGEDDFWRIREFLREVYRINGRRELSWQTYRLDYWRWHVNANIFELPLDEVVFIWEMAGREIAAVLNPENRGHAFPQVHPDVHTPALAEEMLDTAEAHLAVPDANGRRTLHVWANEHDDVLHAILIDRGYTRGDRPEYHRRRPFSIPIPDVPVPEGYSVRALGGTDEVPARSWVSWRAFHPDEPDETYEGWDWYLNVQRAALYRRQLDIVAVAPDGEFAAFCTAWFDDVTRTGAFEPVGTSPNHQRRGLGRAVMCEALRRLKRLGATLATVGSSSPEAGAFYDSLGFSDYDRAYPWTKTL